VILRNGETVTDLTATDAQQWGELALVTLVGVEGMWTTSVLEMGACATISVRP
jgi:hypothetical protein